MTHSSLELLSLPYLNTRKATTTSSSERQNRGAYNTFTDERQTKGGRPRERASWERLIKNTCCWSVQPGPEQNPIITWLFLSISASILHYKWSIHRDSLSNRAESPDQQHTCSATEPRSVPKISSWERTGKLATQHLTVPICENKIASEWGQSELEVFFLKPSIKKKRLTFLNVKASAVNQLKNS